MDIQLPMFDDLRFWSDKDLADYHTQCLGDLRAMDKQYANHEIPAEELGNVISAKKSLREEIAAIHSELALRALLAD